VTNILVSTEPAELLQTNGEEIKWYKEHRFSMLLTQQTEIFKDINSQKTYVTTRGEMVRRIKSQWTMEYIASDKLPEDFAKNSRRVGQR